jgi:hypothetical protein
MMAVDMIAVEQPIEGKDSIERSRKAIDSRREDWK